MGNSGMDSIRVSKLRQEEKEGGKKIQKAKNSKCSLTAHVQTTRLFRAFSERQVLRLSAAQGPSKICLTLGRWLSRGACLPGRKELPSPGGSTAGLERAGGSGALLPPARSGSCIPQAQASGSGRFPRGGHWASPSRPERGSWRVGSQETPALLGAGWTVGSLRSSMERGQDLGPCSGILLRNGVGGRARGCLPWGPEPEGPVGRRACPTLHGEADPRFVCPYTRASEQGMYFSLDTPEAGGWHVASLFHQKVGWGCESQGPGCPRNSSRASTERPAQRVSQPLGT